MTTEAHWAKRTESGAHYRVYELDDANGDNEGGSWVLSLCDTCADLIENDVEHWEHLETDSGITCHRCGVVIVDPREETR